MKICVISLNRCNGDYVRDLLNEKDISTKYFYNFETLDPEQYTENIDGIRSYIDSIYYAYDAFIEFPYSFAHEYMYEKDSDTKFIHIDIEKTAWIDKMNSLKDMFSHKQAYLFEEFFCNYYLKTDKKMIQQLDDQELEDIYILHNQSIDEFFKDSSNYLKVDINDPEYLEKIIVFLNI